MTLKKLYLELTNKCNLNCSICYRRSWNEEPTDMSLELFNKIKKEIGGINSLKSIVLGGIGEPTCAPLIYEAIGALGHYHLTLTTNAMDMNDELLDLIVRRVNLVMVSIDGLHENFSKIRTANLDAVIENMNRINRLKENAAKSSPFVGIQFVLSRDNADDISRMIDLAADVKAHLLVLSNLLPQTKENAEKILYTRYENRQGKLLFDKALKYSFKKGIKLVLPNFELKTERRCSFVEDGAAFIDAWGEMVPCYRLSHTYKEYVFDREKTVIKNSFGSLYEKDIKSIWESSRYSHFRSVVRNNRYPSCIDCDYVEGCDLVKDTYYDCYTQSPSCADCLWARKYIICP
jgi:tungsten cofactor oxidoreducase radical SAM maturase